MEQIFEVLFTRYIDVTLAVLIVVSAYFFRKFLCDVFLPKINMAHKVLMWSTVITIIYYFLFQRTGVTPEKGKVVYLITYFFATSFYELLFQPVVNWITKKSQS